MVHNRKTKKSKLQGILLLLELSRTSCITYLFAGVPKGELTGGILPEVEQRQANQTHLLKLSKGEPTRGVLTHYSWAKRWANYRRTYLLGLSEGEPIGGVCRQESHDLTLVHRHGQTSQVTHDVDQLLNCRLLSLYRLESCAKNKKEWKDGCTWQCSFHTGC